MLYHAPTGSSDANAPYVGKNVAAGQQGSKVPPAAIEYTQREIVAAIAAAGMTPTDTDLQQLLRAIRGGKLEYYVDGAPATGTAAPTPVAGSPAILPNPAHTTLFDGLHVRVKMGSPCTGATNLAVNGLSAPIKRRGFVALAGGEWATGDILDLTYSAAGNAFQVCGLVSSDVLALISTALATLKIPGSVLPAGRRPATIRRTIVIIRAATSCLSRPIQHSKLKNAAAVAVAAAEPAEPTRRAPAAVAPAWRAGSS